MVDVSVKFGLVDSGFIPQVGRGDVCGRICACVCGAKEHGTIGGCALKCSSFNRDNSMLTQGSTFWKPFEHLPPVDFPMFFTHGTTKDDAAAEPCKQVLSSVSQAGVDGGMWDE